MKSLNLLIVTLILIFPALALSAQESTPEATTEPTPEGWPIVERCITESTILDVGDEWPFEGSIFTTSEQGVRALHADIGIPYFVAFNNFEQFTDAGAVSPDGTMFALPGGTVDKCSNMMCDDYYFFNEIRVYSTDPNPELLNTIEWNDRMAFFGGVAGASQYPLNWLEEEILSNYWRIQSTTWEETNSYLTKINVISGEISPLNVGIPDIQELEVSFDQTRIVVRQSDPITQMATWSIYSLENINLLSLLSMPNQQFRGVLSWLPDSSGFLGAIRYVSENGEPIREETALFSRDGLYNEQVTPFIISDYRPLNRQTFDINSAQMAFLLYDTERRDQILYLADLSRHQITNTCLAASSLALSPTGQEIAFTGDNFISILDIEDEKIHVIPYEVGSIISWREG